MGAGGGGGGVMARKEGWSRCRSTRREECDKRGGEQRTGTAERLVSGGAASIYIYIYIYISGRHMPGAGTPSVPDCYK